MSSADQPQRTDDLPPNAAAPPAVSPDTGNAAVERPGPAPERLGLFVGGLLAGVLAWAVFATCYPFFEPPVVERRGPPSPDEIASLGALLGKLAIKNAVAVGLVFGVVGAVVLGLAAGMRRGPWGRSLLMVLVALVCGGLGGGATGLVSHHVFLQTRFAVAVEPMTRTLAVQAVFWAALGGVLGLAVGLCLRRPSAIVGAIGRGVLGGALAALVYVPVAGWLFPKDDAERLVPETCSNQAVWAIASMVLVGIALGQARQRGGPR